MILRWYKNYSEEQETGIENPLVNRKKKYTNEQKEKAVAHYVEHGKSLARIIRALGYPSKSKLREWCAESLPSFCKVRASSIQHTKKQKKEKIIDFCTREDNAEVIATNHKVIRMTLYNWKNILLDRETNYMDKYNKGNLSSKKEEILEGTIQLLKKIRVSTQRN